VNIFSRPQTFYLADFLKECAGVYLATELCFVISYTLILDYMCELSPFCFQGSKNVPLITVHKQLHKCF